MEEYWMDADTELGEDEFLTPEDLAAIYADEWEQGRREREAEALLAQSDWTDSY